VGYVEDLRGKKQGQGRPRWRARYRDPSGRERSRSFTRKVDAEQFLVSIEDVKLRGAYVDPAAGKVPFAEWAERWFRTTADLKPSSRRTYRKLLDKQILPAFERASLGGIDTLAVREWIAGLVERGLSPSRVRSAHQVLSQILAAGVEGGRIVRNPAAGVRLPRIVRRNMHFLTARQVEDLAAAVDPRYELLIRFAAYTGLRAGELVALRVRHVNLLRGRCEVGESATEVDGRLAWGPTKTYAHRTAHLPRFLCEQLAAYLTERPHGPDDLVFTAPQGGPLREQKFVAGIFKPAAVRAGLFVTRHLQPGTGREVVSSDLRFHDLRHTCASLLIAQGASVKAVQAQLGHASATVTLDRYGHLFPDELQQLADRLQDAYAQAVTDPARTEATDRRLGQSKGAGQ
jgi:integrase